MYLILQKFLKYPKINKSKRYNKPIMQIFVKVQYFYKCFGIVIILSQDFWDIIAIIITLNMLYNNFDITTIYILKFRNKMTDQI